MAIPAMPRIVPAITWASVGGGATTTGGPTPLSRSDPILRFVRSRQRFVRWSHCPMSQSITARPMRYAAPADQATTPITSISGLKPPQPPPAWLLQNTLVNYAFLDNRCVFWTTDLAGPVKCGAMGQTFYDTCAYGLGSCSSAPKICSLEPS